MLKDGPKQKICLIAGEESGDLLGARLMAALKEEISADTHFVGVGGRLMEEQGLKSIFAMRDLSVMGIIEVLPRLPKILRRIHQTVTMIKNEKPDLVITIDSPDFCFRVAKAVKEQMNDAPKMLHYVAPTVWAWRPERAKKVARLYDGIMCLYPFEPTYFENEGLKARFVGHSVLESGYEHGNGKELRKELNIEENEPVLGVLFGSRMGELNKVGPCLRAAVEQIADQQKNCHVLSPTLPHLERQVKNLLEGLPCKVHVISDVKKKWDCFSAMDKAFATSGTVGLELAVAGVPHVIAYKMNPISWQIIKRKVTVDYAHLANILLNEPVVGEFIQDKCKAGAIASGLSKIDEASQKQAFDKAREQLSGSNDNAPSLQAAKFIGDYLRSSITT